MKFLNKTDATIRVATLAGHCAIFAPGQTLQVPAVMKKACLAEHLSLVEGADEVVPETVPAARKASSRKGKKAVVVEAEAAAAEAEMGQTVVEDTE